MRQNPMMSSRVQVGGRPMPSWFSASLVNQSRATMSTPPPLPAEPPPSNDESEYEEIDHLPKHNGARKSSGRNKRVCNLCGNTNPVVSCEMCENQIFCGSCNDMYHRHPKRLHHARKLLETLENKPPLPPKTFLVSTPPAEEEVQTISITASLPPVPPPRVKKRFGMRSATSSPTTVRKSNFDPMGTLKRFMGGMGQRPLPPPPKPAPPLPPKPSEMGRPMTPVNRGQGNMMGFDRRQSSPAPLAHGMYPSEQRFPLTVNEMQTHNPRHHQSISVANLNDHHNAFINGGNSYPDWEDDEDFFARQRAHSISTPHGARYPSSSQDVSHFATLQRPNKHGTKPPERPPPPVPPRNFSSQSQLGFQSSQSVFNLNHMGMPPQFGMPWNYPVQGYPIDFQQQQALMMGYPGTMRRTPSNQSMGAGPPQGFFQWGPMGFGPPMSQQEMEMGILAARQGSEPPVFHQRPRSVSQSQPVTPQGSFRKKTRPSIGHDRHAEAEARITERFIQTPQIKPRPTTPSSFARVKPMAHSRENDQDSIQGLKQTSNESGYSAVEILEDPEGPWICEHCTFINPKSIKVCTICCKTPSNGYRCTGQSAKPDVRRRESSSSIQEDVPIVESKLSISRGEKQQATINLVERVERVKSPTDKRSTHGSRGKTVKINEMVDDNEDEEEDEEEEFDDNELELQAQHHQFRINTKKTKVASTTSQITDSNEDVYGSVPIQALTISPKIEIRRPPKTVTTTGVGSSPPKVTTQESAVGSSPPKATTLDSNLSGKSVKLGKDGKGKSSPANSSKSRSSDSNDNLESRKENSRRSSGSSGPKPGKNDKVNPPEAKPEAAQVSKKVLSVSTGVQADNGESGNESNRSGTSSTGSDSRNSDLPSSVSSGGNRSEVTKYERKTSKGTSPPPQSISTQTYEDLPPSSMRKQHSMSKTSMTSMQSLQSDDYAPPKPIEMSEKALRYARKAQHNHQAKLKRSMSTHLTSASEPWVDNVDGRNLYRSSSRHSLLSDTRSLPLSGPPSRDASPPSRGSRFYEDFRRFPPPSWDRFPTPEDYFASFEDLVSRRSRRDSTRSHEFELNRLLKDAEEYNYTPEDVQVALRMCGEKNPIKWLQENWSSMVETVQTLSTKYGREKGQDNNQIGTVSSAEAKDSLRSHKGNVWAAVTECIEQRRKKFKELQSRGTFLREDILTALTANYGNLDAAYVELSKAQLKPFLMRIYGPPSGLDNDAVPPSPSVKNFEMDQSPSISDSKAKMETEEEPSPKAIVEKIIIQPLEDNKTAVVLPVKSIEMPVPSTQEDSQTKNVPVKEEQLKEPSDIPSLPEKVENLEPEPRLELLVSSAAKVTQEIEKAIQELIISKSKPEDVKTKAPSPVEIKSETESNAPAHHNVRSDEGEDESFADAVSDSDVNLASPKSDGRESLVDMEEDDVEFDEDVLEIEIDDSEANISEFIQNYEILPPKQPPVVPTSDLKVLESEEKIEMGNVDQKETASVAQNHDNDNQLSLYGSTSKEFTESEIVLQDQSQLNDAPKVLLEKDESGIASAVLDTKDISRLSSTEVEQLLSTLTTTFTEMGQFANEIKEKIATEIQQQLAAAVNSVAVNNENNGIPTTSKASASSEDANEPFYEPITLPESITENVNKKIAKYKRLAAKKQQKSNRHKSPENRAFHKEPSASPSPASSLTNVSRRRHTSPPEEAESVNRDTSGSRSNTYTDAEVKIVENAAIEKEEESEVQDEVTNPDYEEVNLVRDEEEYDSGSDAAESSEEIEEEIEDEEVEEEEEEEEEVEEEEEEVEESEEGSDLVSSDQDGEVQKVFENDADAYEEVEISHSSNYDLYSNKDTDKTVVTNNSTQNQKVSFATPNTPLADIALVEKNSTDVENFQQTKLQKDSLGSPQPKSELEVKIARLIKEGKSETTEKAELAMQLIDMNFGEEDAIYAANECSSLYSALSYLQQECDLCAGKFSARQMVSMLKCTHVCCQNCAKEYFTVQIRDKTIVDATCPFCSEPTNLTEDAETATEYFNHLDILLKSLVESRYHEMFQRKLRDWALAQTPNFKWCSKCSSGFITEPLQTRLICPDCNAVTCAICLEQWDKVNHDHRETKVKVCDSASKSIVDYLNENSIECPRCHFRFALARGGCMHLTCTQCRHEFCSGCSAPFRMGAKCEAKLPICDRLGLHAHHPRNCLFYLRDKEPDILCKLLEESAIPYLKEDSGVATEVVTGGDTPRTSRACQVPIQKETSDGLKDDVCGKEAPAGYATVCKGHYVEYLGLLIWQNHLDPISILSSDDLEVIIRRAHKKHPGRPYPTSDEDFRKRLLKVIQEEIPL